MPKIIAISDTHGSHAECKKLPSGDLLVHSGDCTSDGSIGALRNFLTWFEAQPCPEKVLVAGNHDWTFQRDPGLARATVAEYAPSVRYLEDHGELIAGIYVWGSPYQPFFMNWAFNEPRGGAIKRHWDMIPHGVDLLITHGPAYGVLDKAKKTGENLGCEELAKCVTRIKPKIHVHGHIHYSYGLHAKDGILSINASVMNENYDIVNSPVIINL